MVLQGLGFLSRWLLKTLWSCNPDESQRLGAGQTVSTVRDASFHLQTCHLCPRRGEGGAGKRDLAGLKHESGCVGAFRGACGNTAAALQPIGSDAELGLSAVALFRLFADQPRYMPTCAAPARGWLLHAGRWSLFVRVTRVTGAGVDARAHPAHLRAPAGTSSVQ